MTVLCFSGCSRSLGYGVVLWSMPEQELYDGDIVHVLIKSNISHVYVIEKNGKKIEVPLWLISEPESKSKTKLVQEKYSEYQHKYALVALDGLPMRAQAVNSARQVYRMRQNEKVRILYEGEGQPVMAGKDKPLEGKWLRIMSSDGTQGWCFSYNLRLFDDREGTAVVAQKENVDQKLESMLAKKWYPENYRQMINSGRIDLDAMNVNYGFDTGAVTQQTRLVVPGLAVNYPFKGAVKQQPNVYDFTDMPILVTIRQEDFIVVQFTNSKGHPEAYNMITLAEDVKIADIIAKERTRRDALWDEIKQVSVKFTSSNYGVLQLLDGRKFMWSGYSLLSPDYIPSNAGKDGIADFKYFLSRALLEQFDGMVTFNFNGASEEINFFYKLEENGLRLESAKGAVFRGKNVNERSPNSMTMFFSK
jgi:hypothetical protein